MDVIVHCNLLLETVREVRILRYQGKEFMARISVGLCAGCGKAAYAVQRFLPNGELLDTETDLPKWRRLQVEKEIQDAKRAKPVKRGIVRDRGRGVQVCEYTEIVNRPADDETVHKYLDKLDHLPAPHKRPGKLMADELISAQRDEWNRELRDKLARRCG